jgi:hypothetical protein
MILRLAIRSLAMRPMRTAVLAVGFGLGIAVMAELVGVGEVILEQAHSPALAGGGDAVVTGPFGGLDNGRFMLATVLGSERLRSQIRVASPARRATVYLTANGETIPVSVRSGIPDRETAIADPELAGQSTWRNTRGDDEWMAPTQAELLRAMDRFHPIPSAGPPSPDDGGAATSPAAFGPATWAEWLYFNGRSADGSLRFYVTFLAPGAADPLSRPLLVRVQLNRGGATANYSAAETVGARDLLERAPDVDVGGSRVRLGDDGVYRITLAMPRLSGELTLTPVPGRSLPPAEIHGARGWVSGYVVPVLAGTFSGALRVDGQPLRVDGVAGYHDHNWGYWEDVRWQWGQVAGGGVSIVYGRVFPPADVANRDRVPGFLGVLGPDGPIGFSTDVSIDETPDNGTPRAIAIRSRDRRGSLALQFTVRESVRTPLALTAGPGGTVIFLQLGGEYHVSGRVGDRDIDFTARGSAETFRQKPAADDARAGGR